MPSGIRSLVAWVALALVSSACAPPACADGEERGLERDVQLVLRDDGRIADVAADRLAAAGRRAIVMIEAGFYGADPPARRRLVAVLRRLADPEAAPIFRHLARRDPDADVRARAEAALAEISTRARP